MSREYFTIFTKPTEKAMKDLEQCAFCNILRLLNNGLIRQEPYVNPTRMDEPKNNHQTFYDLLDVGISYYNLKKKCVNTHINLIVH